MLYSCYFMSMEIKYTKVFFTIYHWKVWILVFAMLHTVQCVDTEGCSLYKWLVWHRINILASWTRGFHELSKSLQINWDELINNNASQYYIVNHTHISSNIEHSFWLDILIFAHLRFLVAKITPRVFIFVHLINFSHKNYFLP